MTAHNDVAGPVDSRSSKHVHLHTLPYHAVTLKGGFWQEQRAVNRSVSLRMGREMLEKAGNFHNLRLAAGLTDGPYRGTFPFLDSDLYKWLEAVAFELGNGHDPELETMANEAIGLLGKAQQPDGYLNSYYTVVKSDKRWQELRDGHELYCAGHLIQAAVAHHRMTGSVALLNIARRFADYIDSVFGPNKRHGVCGHPEIETALVELYRDSGEKRYLDLAAYFLNERGHGVLGIEKRSAPYYQESVPVRHVSEIEGHAVRALYLTTGVADLYMETGDKALLDALERQWVDMTSRKLFITGGVGSRSQGEAFGEPYELPNDVCYCETCAQIASIMWNWRMLLISGESKYADLMERTLFNGFLSGRSLDGMRTRYENPLLRRGHAATFGPHGNERQEWYGCACCPPNIMRLLSSLPGYFVTHDERGVQMQHYAPCDITADVAGSRVHLHTQTDYPWQETVLLSVEETGDAPWRLSFRIPAWCNKPIVKLNDKKVALQLDGKGYAYLERSWNVCDFVELELPMPARLTVAHPRIDPTRGSAAIERGPLVYCFESPELGESINMMDVAIARDAQLDTVWKGDELGGVVAIKLHGYAVDSAAWGRELYRPLASAGSTGKHPISLVAIPYYAWDNRGLTAMRVWTPLL